MAKKNETRIKQKIDRYIDGELSEKEVDELWAWLIQNQKYMDYMNTAANLKRIVQFEDKKPATVQPIWRYAVAAVIVLLVAVLGILYLTDSTAETELEPIAAIELPYSRSVEVPAQITDREEIIREAIILYYQDKFEQAVSLLQKERNIATDANWIATLDITLGKLYYNEADFEKATFYFSDVVQYKGDIKVLKLEKAYWYLGNAYFQMLQLEKAEAAMRKAYALNGAYHRVIKSYLEAMADKS